MDSFDQYLWPYIGSQVVSVILLVLAWKKPVWARIGFGLLFLGAGIFNWYIALTEPASYLVYAETAIPVYRDFILGWFKENLTIMILLIGIGQFSIGIGMFLKDGWVRAACIGVIVFLLAIAPLGMGSAFPFSITVSVAAFLLIQKNRLPGIWKKH